MISTALRRFEITSSRGRVRYPQLHDESQDVARAYGALR